MVANIENIFYITKKKTDYLVFFGHFLRSRSGEKLFARLAEIFLFERNLLILHTDKQECSFLNNRLH